MDGPERKQNATDFDVPVSALHRIAGIALLVCGIVIIVYAIRVGGVAVLLLPPGIGINGLALWWLSRKTKRLRAPVIAERFDAALAERVGSAASTPEERSHYIHEYLEGVQELKQLAERSGFFGRMHDTYEAVAHFNTPGSEVSVAARPWSDGEFAVFVSGLADREREAAAQVLGAEGTETPEVLYLGKLSDEQTAQATERVFRDVLNRGPEYVLTAWLDCILPIRTY